MNRPNAPGDDGQAVGTAEPGRVEGGNPYRASRASEGPSLDDTAPVLQAGDIRRLNRKALLFLAAIVVVLLCATVWLLRAAGSGDSAPRPREEVVVIPELPRVGARGPAPLAAEPVAATDIPVPLLPPPQQVPAPASFLPPFHPTQSPTLLERRTGDGRLAGERAPPQADPYLQAMMAGLPTAAGAQPAPVASPRLAGSARFLPRSDALLARGTYIRCVLETRIITDVAGFTSCVVTEPIYSIDGRHLLLPRGSKVLGRYDSEPTGPRVAVVWDRIITPSGVDVDMASPGVDGLGGAGHPGAYSAHWGSRIASALLISLISDAFAYAAAEEGPETTTVGTGGVVVQSPFESTTARTMERLANQALAVRRPPTVRINQGTVVNVYVARDVDFSSVLETAR